MPRKQSTAAKKARQAQQEAGGKYTQLLRRHGAPTPEARLAAALREIGDPGLAHAVAHHRGLGDEVHSALGDEVLIQGVVVLLAHVGSAAEPTSSAAPAADVLEAADHHAWADVIRGHFRIVRRGEVYPAWVPLVDWMRGPDTTGAMNARAACRLLYQASQMASDRDEDWTTCAAMIREAGLLARQACG